MMTPKQVNRFLIAVLILTGIAYAGERARSLCKVSHLSPATVAVSCVEGGQPQLAGNVGGALIVSCGY